MGGPDEHHSVDTSDGANDAVCVIVVTAVVPALMFSPPAAGDAAAPAGTSSPAPAGAADNAPLHALTDGQDGPNGVYRYGTGGGFPTLSWQSSSYWVDLTFTAAG